MVEYFGRTTRRLYSPVLAGCRATVRARETGGDFGDLSRPKAMTVEWIRYAQSLTRKVMVKGMLTGPVTMLMVVPA